MATPEGAAKPSALPLLESQCCGGAAVNTGADGWMGEREGVFQRHSSGTGTCFIAGALGAPLRPVTWRYGGVRMQPHMDRGCAAKCVCVSSVTVCKSESNPMPPMIHHGTPPTSSVNTTAAGPVTLYLNQPGSHYHLNQ